MGEGDDIARPEREACGDTLLIHPRGELQHRHRRSELIADADDSFELLGG